jgi:hypothetical protein
MSNESSTGHSRPNFLFTSASPRKIVDDNEFKKLLRRVFCPNSFLDILAYGLSELIEMAVSYFKRIIPELFIVGQHVANSRHSRLNKLDVLLRQTLILFLLPRSPFIASSNNTFAHANGSYFESQEPSACLFHQSLQALIGS